MRNRPLGERRHSTLWQYSADTPFVILILLLLPHSVTAPMELPQLRHRSATTTSSGISQQRGHAALGSLGYDHKYPSSIYDMDCALMLISKRSSFRSEETRLLQGTNKLPKLILYHKTIPDLEFGVFRKASYHVWFHFLSMTHLQSTHKQMIPTDIP